MIKTKWIGASKPVDDECYFCKKVLPWDRPDSGFSEYCGEACYAKQCAKERKEEGWTD
jgi:hypothetical protein